MTVFNPFQILTAAALNGIQTAEAAARVAGDATEASARVAADTAETAARIAADAAITAAMALPARQAVTGNFYQNEGGFVNRMADRLLVGAATINDAFDPFSSPGNVTKDWLSTYQAEIGLNPTSEATFASMPTSIYGLGVLGAAQSKHFINPNQSAIGICGYAYNDSPTLLTPAWAFYGESHRRLDSTNNSYGMELAIVQQGGTEHRLTPAIGAGGPGFAIGLQLDSGNGFNQTLQPGLCAASAGLVLSNNSSDGSSPFLSGIIFYNDAIRMVSGVGEAIALSQGHALNWYNNAGSATSSILSQTTTINGSTNINMAEGSLQIGAPAYGSLLVKFNVVASAVNYLSVTPNIAGQGPTIAAAGADTAINIVLAPKGGGTVIFSGNANPQLDNAMSCGASGARWSAVWAANGAIQTSDATLKTDIEQLPAMLPILAALHPVTYKWVVGGSKPVVTQVEVAEDVYENVSETVEDHEVQPDGTVHLISKVIIKRQQVFDQAAVTLPDGTPVIDQVPVTIPGKAVTYIAKPRMHSFPRKQKVMVEHIEYVEKPGARTHWGFLAKDVKDALAVTGRDFAGYVRGEDGTEALRPDQLIPVLWKAVQELSADFAAYKAAHQ